MNKTLSGLIKRIFGEKGSNRLRLLRRMGCNPLFFVKYGFSNLVAVPQLKEIGIRFGTDKAHEVHNFSGLSYLDIYERYFSAFRDKQVSILEIGVKNGESLRTWKTYFPQGSVYGIDIDPRCKEQEEDRIKVEIGSQDDPKFLAECFGKDTRFDIIVDDGSHVNTFTIASYSHLFGPRLNSGGIYILEDLKCSYQKLQTDLQARSTWPGMKYNDEAKDFDNDRKLIDDFFNEKIHRLDHATGDILSMHFYYQTCVITKV